MIDIFAATDPCSSEVAQSSCPKCSINIFTFQPFGRFDVINVTERNTYDGFFPSQNSNFQRQHIRLGSNIYNSTDDGKLWLTVFRLMNATFDAEIYENGVDLYPPLMGQQQPKQLRVYPMKFTSFIIIVPEALPYSDFSAYLRNVTSGEFCGYSCVAVVALVLVLSILRSVKQKKILFCQSTVDVFNLLINDNGYIKYQRLSRSEIFVIVPLTFVGLIFTNGILSALQSHVTRPLIQPQLKTMEDIDASGFSIAALYNPDKLQVIIGLFNRAGGKEWSDKMFMTKLFYDDLCAYNLSMCYFLDADYAQIILRVQKRLKIKGYHNPDIEIAKNYRGYLVYAKFLYFERLNDILHRIKSAGLYDLWKRQDEANDENVLLKQNVERLANQIENYVESFEFPTFLFYGWLAGLIAFMFEIMWKRFGESWMKKILRTIDGKF